MPLITTFAGDSARGFGLFKANGAASSFESIATVTASGSQSTITFSSIPSTYKSLQIRVLATDASASITDITFNGDTGSNYAWHRLYGNGTSAVAQGTGTTTRINNSLIASGVANCYAVGIYDIVDYANTSKYKTTRSFWGNDSNGSATGYVTLISGLWQSTAAVSSITFTCGANYTAGSTFALYGIKG